MRRLVLVAAVLACVLLMLPAVARAAADDIPGTPMTVGSTVTGVLDDTTKKYDVYSIQLISGEQVQLDVSDSTKGPCVRINLIAPGATSIFASWSSLANASTYSTGIGQFTYTPARDGVYFLRVEADGKGVSYAFTVSRTSTPATTSPDSNDIFGIAIGLGSVAGVVDDVTDKYDVYAVSLFAQEQVQLDVSDSTKGPCVRINLIAPGATSIFASWSSLANASTYSTGIGQFTYTPARDGVYFLRVEADGKGVVYALTLSGSAEKPPYPSLLKLRSSAAQVKKGRSVTLTATLATPTGDPIGGKSVSLQSSVDGKSWKTANSLSSGSGRYSAAVVITRSTWFRMTFGGDDDHGACVSRKLLVKAT